jgi:hypothetical protein
MSEGTNASEEKPQHDDPCITLLEKMLDLAKRGLYSEEIKNEIVDSNTCYVTGRRDDIDPETLKYYFTGWWVHQNLSGAGFKDLSTGDGTSSGAVDVRPGASPDHLQNLHD